MECVNLRRSDIDWGGRRVTILGKGDKLATIPLSLDMRDLMCPLQVLGGDHVFTMDPRVRKDGFTRRHGVRGTEANPVEGEHERLAF